MSIYFGSGQTFNVLGRVAAANISMSPAASTSFPTTYLYDMDPATIGAFGSATTDSRLTVDCNILLGGDFDAAFTGSPAAPVNWTNVCTGTGVISQTTAAGEFVTGPALKCISSTSATGFGGAQGIITARPDEQLRLIGRLRGGGGAKTAAVYIRNPVTGKYWSAGSWVTGQTAAVSTNSSAYTAGNECDLTVTMESYQACAGLDTVNLQLIVGTAPIPSQLACFDNFYSWPVTNFAALIGIQNIGPSALATPPRVWEWYSDEQSSFATQVSIALANEATGPGKGLPNSYVKASADNTLRYNRFNFPGLPTAAPSFGEAFFGYITTAARSQNYGWSVSMMKRQVRNVSRGGQVRVYPYATYPERELTLSFRHTSRSDFEELLHQWFIRSGGGQFPIMVVADTSGTGLDQMIMYGRMPERIKITRSLTTLWDWDAVVLTECPLP